MLFHQVRAQSEFRHNGVRYCKIDCRQGMTAEGVRVRFRDSQCINVTEKPQRLQPLTGVSR